MLVTLSETPTIMNFEHIREMVRMHPSPKEYWAILINFLYKQARVALDSFGSVNQMVQSLNR